MGWQSDDGSHEGWDAPVFPGDRYGLGSGGGGALVRRYAPGPGPLREVGDLEEGVDGHAVTGWRGLCSCGWRGPLWVRVSTGAEEDTDVRRVWWGLDANPYGDAPADVEAGIFTEWRAHLEPPALAAVRAAAREAAAAADRLTAAVRAARADRRSWADIGAMVGITRQSAYERWSRITG
ncbi:hypothetical protein [Streptosporangium saharense]|uniref:AsnC family protein n=1 Tax=Streptosporangium saharense TaxID=1706840 RepID=A0A7W7QWC9_9ACTN|nr:hypothetical protein [Streptosporangium saharense]MBB4920988.1 hypothetical protein [Streptosporangium saharense]